MKIRAGFTIAYECGAPTPMLLVLNLHPSRRGDLLTDQALTFDPPIEARDYLDGFGRKFQTKKVLVNRVIKVVTVLLAVSPM